MKNKNIFSSFRHATLCMVFFTVLFFQTSCEDSIEGDVNVDPLVGNDINVDLLMPQILLAGYSATRTIELNAMNSQAQHWSAIVGFGVFVNPERYNIGPNTVNNTWVFNFTFALRNLQQVRLLTEANNPTARNTIGQARILEAFAFLNLTQIFGSIPFNEATDVEQFPIPNFDSQEEVLRGIPALVDSGIAELQTDTDIIQGADLLYGGDRESWIRFGNSLKLKALMLVANVDAASVQAELQNVANQPLILESSQNATLDFVSSAGNENPLQVTLDNFNGGVNGFWGAGSTLVDVMNATEDPRRATFFDTVAVPNDTVNGVVIENDPIFAGQDQGVFASVGISTVSANIIRDEMPDIYASASETNFYLAEAALRGLIAGDANEFYRAGIQQSLDFYDNTPGAILQADKDVFMTSARASIVGLSDEDALERIHVEHWISDFTRPIEAWTTWRRNKVPEFQLPVQANLPTIIRRYQYPVSEITANPNAPANLPLDTPMWFENE